MSFVVELSPTAEVDLGRLFDFLLDQADTTEDLDRAQAAIDAIRAIEPAVTRRYTVTGRNRPMRWVRPMAWSSAAGFHQGSTIST